MSLEIIFGEEIELRNVNNGETTTTMQRREEKKQWQDNLSFKFKFVNYRVSNFFFLKKSCFLRHLKT